MGFDGELNDGDRYLMMGPPVAPVVKLMSVDQNDLVLLEKILDRDRTAKETHGGLKGLLSLTDADVDQLREFVARVRGRAASSR